MIGPCSFRQIAAPDQAEPPPCRGRNEPDGHAFVVAILNREGTVVACRVPLWVCALKTICNRLFIAYPTTSLAIEIVESVRIGVWRAAVSFSILLRLLGADDRYK